MAWFKVDDKFPTSVEVMSIPVEQRAAAIGLWCLAGAWSSDHLTDGSIPASLIESWGGSRELAAALVKVRLWERSGRSDFQFRNWGKWQPIRAEVLQKRAEATERVRNHRSRVARDSGASNDDVTRYKDDVTLPPTRPDPTRKEEELLITPDGAIPTDARFEEFWSIYPRKVGRVKAQAKFADAVKHGTPAEIIVLAARRYARDPNLPIDRQYIPHPATWLFQGRWGDESQAPRTPSGEQKQMASLALVDRYRDEERNEEITGGGVANLRAIGGPSRGE